MLENHGLKNFPTFLAEAFVRRMSLSLHLTQDSVFVDRIEGHETLLISTQTWGRDSHDLFDYETSQIHCQQFRLTGRAISLYRRGNDVVVVTDGSPRPSSAEYLTSVCLEKTTGSFRILQREGMACKKLWSVVRANSPSGVRLREGLVLKLGRFKLRVRQICMKPEDTQDISSYSNGTQQQEPRAGFAPDLRLGTRGVISGLTCADSDADMTIKQLQCRICLGEGPSEHDPLIVPCECTGSIRYVHARCLGHWLKGRLGLDNYNGSVFFFRPLACELCHCIYPSYFVSDDSATTLATLPDTRTPFVVFENLGGASNIPAWNSDSSNTFPAGLHVVQFDQALTCIKIGRGHECQMRISDVSISRLHALLRIGEDGHIYLEDQQSKFGTLVDDNIVASGGFEISNGDSLSLQSGRTLISLSVGHPSGSDQDTVNDTDMFEDALEDDILDDQRPQTH